MAKGSTTVEKFDAACYALKKSRKKQTIIFLMIFFVVLVISIHVGEFSLSNLIEGLPGLLNYVKDTVPEMHRHSIAKDVGGVVLGIRQVGSIARGHHLFSIHGDIDRHYRRFCLVFSRLTKFSQILFYLFYMP